MEALWLLIAVSMALRMYQDARQRPNVPWMKAPAWSLATLVLFPLVLPLYLWVSRPIPEHEEAESPVTEPAPRPRNLGRATAAVALAFALGLLLGAPSKASRGVLFQQAPVTAPRIQIDGKTASAFQVDGIRYWVGKALKQASIRHQVDTTKANGVFVVVELAVASNDGTPRLVPSSRLFLKDRQGRRYSTSLEGETALLFQTGKSLFLEPAQPGLRRWGHVVFDVPADAQALTFEVAPLNFWEPTPQAKL